MLAQLVPMKNSSALMWTASDIAFCSLASARPQTRLTADPYHPSRHLVSKNEYKQIGNIRKPVTVTRHSFCHNQADWWDHND